MGLLSNLIKTTIDIATTPIDIVSDVVNVGDGRESETSKKVKKITEDITDIFDDLV